jgi:hypothetical protein
MSNHNLDKSGGEKDESARQHRVVASLRPEASNPGFEQQKAAFRRIPESERERYKGRFVVSRDGVIVDHDIDLVELGRRFFGQHGKVPVYITRIGKPVRMRSPFVR